VALTRSRQRKLARDRYERQMVRRAERQRRQRQVQAGIGAFVLLALVVAGAAWLGGWFESEPEPVANADRCAWQPVDPTAVPERLDVGTPPTDPPADGQRMMTVDLDSAAAAGTVEVALDVAADPCAAASMEHLAAQGFYDGTTCHELTEGAALGCGDPGGTGVGGPAYAFFGTNLPVVEADAEATNGPPVAYPAGTVALADDGGRNGSQFLIFFEDYHTEQPFWPVIGEVTAGLGVVGAIAAAGTMEGSTEPAEPVTVRALTIADPDGSDTGSPDES
jgi:peptidyl-prolyl cis-trans isomerase B (cyclophilin B)